MSKTRPKRPDQIAREHNRLQKLLEEALNHDALNARFRQALPAHLSQLVTLISVQQGILTVVVPDGTVAARLRMEQSAIMSRLREGGEPFDYCYTFRIRIRPQARAKRARPKPIPISKENAGLLLQEARQTDDEGLSKVLEALARQAR
ncbi:MAG: DUF721 domain-containing protein [Gammaproteobacteria bacterium]|nr:MAG: DUF721 domain-containing protein [Gammaproteobacteria bacterium]